MQGLLTVTQAAERLDITPTRVRQLIASGGIKAQKVGSDWIILEADLKKFKRRPAGRPKADERSKADRRGK